MAARALREEGNKHFRSVSTDLPPLVSRDRLSKAVAAYSAALSLLDSLAPGGGGGDRQERSKCHKNLAAAHRRLATVALLRHQSTPDRSCGHDVARFHLSSSIANFLDAIIHGSRVQSSAWIADIKASLVDLAHVAAADAVLGSQPSVAKACKMFRDRDHLIAGPLHASAVFHRAYCETLLRKAGEMIGDADRGEGVRSFLAALGILADCAAPLEIAAKHGEYREFRDEIWELQRRVELQRQLCESIQARKNGEDLRELAGKATDPDKRVDLLLCALDHFRESELLARDCDNEARVLAMGSIGQVLVTMGLEEQGEEIYSSAIQLGDSILKKPSVQTSSGSKNNFVKLVERMKKAYHILGVRKKVKNRDYEELRNKVYVKLEAKFAKNKGDVPKFLEFLLAEHPPPGLQPPDRKQIVDESKQSPRSALKKTLRLYHPDHNQAGKNTQWKVESQEITKFLVLVYTDKAS